jgi:hypothetical protein
MTCPGHKFGSLCGEHSTEHAWAAEAEGRTRSTPAGQAPPILSSTTGQLFSLFAQQNLFVKLNPSVFRNWYFLVLLLK